MAILEEEVWITCGGVTDSHYESLGYVIPRAKDKQNRIRVPRGTKILVNIEDVPKGSSTLKVTKVCDDCGEQVFNQPYSAIMVSRDNGDGKDRCFKCGRNYSGKIQKNNMIFEKSLEYWAQINNKLYLLDEFSNKNKKRPSEISYGTGDDYLWDCPNCLSEYDMSPHDRTSPKDCGCPFCAGKRVNHRNCLWTTNPEIAKLLKNPQRGYEITAGIDKKEKFKCPSCNHINTKQVNVVIYYGFSCSKCSDGISYPEKFMFNVLEQLNIEFEKRVLFDWSKNVQHKKLSGNKEYDFYIPSLNCIIEVHGNQHYNGGFDRLGGRSLEDEQKNDRLKEQLAKDNGIEHYIVVDCRKSELEFIKNNITRCELNNLTTLEDINWNKCHEYACNSLVKVVCDLWGKHKNNAKICEELRIGRSTAIRYLKQGRTLDWCDYDSKEEMIKNARKNGKNTKNKKRKEIVQLDLNDSYIKTFPSTMEAERELGINHSYIIQICKGNWQSAGGYKWMYKEDYDQYISQQQINS